MNYGSGRRSVRICLAVLALGLVAGGCDWYQLGDFSGHAGDNPVETAITPANVTTLAARFSATDGTSAAVTPQAVVSGVLYASNTSSLDAYSATGSSGSTGCSGSPVVCSPLWRYSPGPPLGDVAVANGIVYYSTAGGLDAFDATGHTGCSGSPAVCRPLWSASGTFGTPTVSDGTVYVTTSTGLDAFDASGTADCSGRPKVCSPVWTTPNVNGTVTVSAGIAYALSSLGAPNGAIVALDANGTRGCSGTPKVCTPLWQYTPNYQVSGGYAVVSGTTLYVDTFYSPAPRQFEGDIEAFDANGVTGCSGTPLICSPLWSANGYVSFSAPLAGDGSAFVIAPAGLGTYAFAPNGAVEWRASGVSATAIGGSVLYGTDGTDVHSYDAGGSTGCSGSPKICSSLWSAPGTDAIVANGTVFVSSKDSSGHGEIVGYELP